MTANVMAAVDASPPPTEDIRLVVPVDILRAAIRPVLPLTGRDHELPQLRSVFLAQAGPWLVALATDRFRAGMQRVRNDLGEDATVHMLIDRRECKRILRAFKDSLTLSATVAGEWVTWTDDDTTIKTAHLATAVRYPNVAKILLGIHESATPPDVQLMFSPRLLAGFERAAEGQPGREIVVRPATAQGRGLAFAVRVGEDFLGALMGVRVSKGARDYRTADHAADFADVLHAVDGVLQDQLWPADPEPGED